jgi:hypothetical protein
MLIARRYGFQRLARLLDFQRLAGLLGLCAAIWFSPCTVRAGGPAEYVIQISVDGAGPTFLQFLINDNHLPNFGRLQSEGAWTNNARADFDYTITLPNHTCMITGRPVYDQNGDKVAVPGHLWVHNGEPGELDLHRNAHGYVKSTFDVAHDNGLATGLFASKTKFSLYDKSYDSAQGAPDTTGDDNGRDKIDVCVINENPLAMTCSFVLSMTERPLQYSFVHFRNADSAGHAKGWGSPEYIAALQQVDGYLGMIFEMVGNHPKLKGKTAIILSADHGGFGPTHVVKTDPLNYMIPFYAWGAGVAKGADLYQLNTSSRVEPALQRRDYAATTPQPIRNGDGGNLALRLLGLGAVPDSSINAKQDLVTDRPADQKVAATQ